MDVTRDTVTSDVEDFSREAHNFLQNMNLRTMGELADTPPGTLMKRSRDRKLVSHILGVLKKYELS